MKFACRVSSSFSSFSLLLSPQVMGAPSAYTGVIRVFAQCVSDVFVTFLTVFRRKAILDRAVVGGGLA